MSTYRKTRPPRPKRRECLLRSGSRPYALHEVNPPGTKAVKRFLRHKLGEKPSMFQVRAWLGLVKPRPEPKPDPATVQDIVVKTSLKDKAQHALLVLRRLLRIPTFKETST